MTASDKLFLVSSIYGIPVNISNVEQAVTEVETLINLHQHHHVVFFEGNLFKLSLFSEELRNIIANASLVYPDGISVASIAQSHIKRPVSRVSGPSFLLQACEYGVKHQWRHFFLGGAEGVAEKMVRNLQEKYPKMQVAGYYSPPFREMTEEEEKDLKKMIEDSHPDLLWVGLGGPKQEFWIRKHLNKINVPVMLGVGAAFDFHSGNRPWAPPFIRKIGAEWIYRNITGGKNIIKRTREGCLIVLYHVLKNKIESLFHKAEPCTKRAPY